MIFSMLTMVPRALATRTPSSPRAIAAADMAATERIDATPRSAASLASGRSTRVAKYLMEVACDPFDFFLGENIVS